jgi:hypothetical protein
MTHQNLVFIPNPLSKKLALFGAGSRRGGPPVKTGYEVFQALIAVLYSIYI